MAKVFDVSRIAPVFKAAFGKGSVVMTNPRTGNEAKPSILKTGVEFVANKPVTSALLVAGGIGAATKGVAQTAAGIFTKQTAGVVLGTSIGAGVVSNVGLKKSTQAVVNAPSNLGQFSSNISGAIKGENTLKDIFTDNPTLSFVTGGLIAATVGKGIATVSNAIATTENTQALKNLPATTTQGQSAPMLPVTPQTQTLSAGAPKRTTSRRRKTKKSSPSQSLNVRIYNQTRTQNNKFIKMLR